MNKYIAEYIAQRKEEIAENERLAKEAQKDGLIEKLELGKREYRKDFPKEPSANFPHYDSSRNDSYRCIIGEVSDEDYAELLKYVPDDDKPKEASKKTMSGWYTFSIVMLIIGCLGGIIIGFAEESAVTAIAVILGVLVFFSQILLLCKIEYNTRENEQ